MARKRLACWLLTLAALLVCASAPAPASAQPVGMAAPYEYLGWGDPQPPASVIGATGLQSLTLAFVLSHGACNPQWDGRRPLSGGVDESAIDAVRAAGGEVDVSFGGWSGKKLGNACKTVPALAAAYQKVIDAYSLHAIDIDIEHGEMASKKVRARVAEALARVQAANPGLEISITLGTAESGPEADGRSLIADAAQAGLMPSAWTVMPFDFGPPATDMGHASIRAVEGLATDLASTYHVSEAFAYEHAGISSMNGRTDEASETVGPADFQTMLDFARAHHLARFTFWSVDRDRPCGAMGGNGGGADECSGIEQAPYAFSDLVASYHG